jgi:hypothetical protein
MPYKIDEIIGYFCYDPYQNLPVKLKRFLELNLSV